VFPVASKVSEGTYLGQSAEEPPGASLICFVGLFGLWLVPDEVPAIRDTATIITHFKKIRGCGVGRGRVNGRLKVTNERELNLS
jgi:hypothetical protein